MNAWSGSRRSGARRLGEVSTRVVCDTFVGFEPVFGVPGGRSAQYWFVGVLKISLLYSPSKLCAALLVLPDVQASSRQFLRDE
jgi:hypothetical protein